MTISVRLNALQVNELELLFGGAYDSAEYNLPTDSVFSATLKITVPVSANQTIHLVDTETTPVARLEIREVLPDGDSSAWVAGSVRQLRPLGHRPYATLRQAIRAPASAPVRVVFDAGDPHKLARAVRCASSDGARVIVVPEPEAAHLRGAQRSGLLEALAERLIAENADVWKSDFSGDGGAVIFFTGLSGSGKTTIARALVEDLDRIGERKVTLLDGDEVRTFLSAGLGFSRRDRDLNINRVGWVASLIARHGGIAICASIAPFDLARKEIRARVEGDFNKFVLVHVATPQALCEQRDRKGLYAQARAGILAEFTGVSSPYETPLDAELTVQENQESIKSSVDSILAFLMRS